MLEKNGIIYDFLQTKDVEKTIKCIVDVFTSSEPLTQAVGLTKDEFYPFSDMVCIKAAEDGLSHIAKDSETSEVIGFIISEDLIQETDTLSSSIIEKISKIHPILALIENLEKEYIKTKSIQPGQILHMFMLGVNLDYRNRKIAKILLKENMKQAKAKNYQVAICESTGVISQHISLKLGFKEIVSIDYKDYTYQGTKVFAGLSEAHKKCMLMKNTL